MRQTPCARVGIPKTLWRERTFRNTKLPPSCQRTFCLDVRHDRRPPTKSTIPGGEQSSGDGAARCAAHARARGDPPKK